MDVSEEEAKVYHMYKNWTPAQIASKLRRRAKGESAEVVFNRIKTNDPDYLTSVCSQLQTGRWTVSTKIISSSRSLLRTNQVGCETDDNPQRSSIRNSHRDPNGVYHGSR